MVRFEITDVISSGNVKPQHQPTHGKGLLSTLYKGILFVYYQLTDLINNATSSNFDQTLRSISDVAKENINNLGSGANNTLKKLLNYCSTLLSNIDIINFTTFLSKKYQIKNAFHNNCLINFDKPSKVITKEMQGRVFLPFVFPKKNPFSFDHIVLIAVDMPRKEILYYDSQGLSSDDPSRLKVFKEDFNMRQDLESLSQKLFGGEGKIIENFEAVQKDPFNCGVFVLRALDQLSNPKTNVAFKSFVDKGMDEDIRDVRKELGNQVIDFSKK